MRLTKAGSGSSSRPFTVLSSTPRPALTLIAVAFVGVFALDRSTGTAPVQHLYYLPIMLAARAFRMRGGLTAALAAVGLYHLANLSQLTHQYQQSDILQIALFLAVGAVTAKLVTDAHRLRVLAATDDLTGLHNLRSFEPRLASLMRASRQANAPLSLLVLDIDRLKSLNDQHGHLAGGEAVRSVGHILAWQIPPDAIACRYGGDEFVVALPGCGVSRAEQIAADLCRVVSATEPLLLGSRWPAGTLSISVGVACRCFQGAGAVTSLQTEEQAGESLFRAADAALYRAKASGRNRVCSVRVGGARYRRQAPR